MWIDKYSPQSVEELVINKKKVREFIDIIEEGAGGGFLVLHGAPGSCKNTLIRTYCQQYGARLVEHRDTKTQHVEHVFGQKETVQGYQRLAQYPDDLESLMSFIRK